MLYIAVIITRGLSTLPIYLGGTFLRRAPISEQKIRIAWQIIELITGRNGEFRVFIRVAFIFMITMGWVFGGRFGVAIFINVLAKTPPSYNFTLIAVIRGYFALRVNRNFADWLIASLLRKESILRKWWKGRLN